jgi:hypothetical protein
MNVDHPILLGRGGYNAREGRGCIMNVLSWEEGQRPVTDSPASVDPFLRQLGIWANDTCCSPFHSGRPDSRAICAKCTARLLEVGHRTVGSRIFSNRETYLKLATALGIRPAASAECNCGCEQINPPLRVFDVVDRFKQFSDPIDVWEATLEVFIKVTGFEVTPTPQEEIDKALAGLTEMVKKSYANYSPSPLLDGVWSQFVPVTTATTSPF